MNALLRVLAWTIALALVALPVVALVNGWIGAERWPLRTLRLSGELTEDDAKAVRTTVLPFARSGFFAVRLDQAQAALAKLPWVQRAEVHKHWPDVLEVGVVAYRPFALWGADKLVSDRGQVFPRGGIALPKAMPQLEGPDARAGEVIALYDEARTLFAPQRLAVRSLRLDARGSWSMTMSSGTEVVIGGTEARLRLQRFAHLLPQLLAQRPQPLQRADLRYTNGFALIWADGQAQAGAAGPSAAAVERPATDDRAGVHAFAIPLPRMASNETRQSAAIPQALRT